MKNILKFMMVIVASFSLMIILKPLDANAEDMTNLPQSNEIMYDCNKNLSEEEIENRFLEIGQKYNVEEAFSDEDAEFVVHYATKEVAVPNESTVTEDSKPLLKGVNFYKGASSKNFNKSKTSMGVKVTFSGKVSSHLNSINPSDQWYSGKTTAKINSGSSKVTKLKTVISQNTYGLIGNSGTYIGLVHSSSLSSTSGKKATVNYLDQKRKYTALLVTYTYTTAYVSVSTSSGTFNLYGL